MKLIGSVFAAALAGAAPWSGPSFAQQVPAQTLSESGPIRIERLAPLEFPWGMAFLPDGDLLITEKPGRLRRYAAGALTPPLEGLPEIVYKEQAGLLDVAVDPDFATNRKIYLFYVEAAAEQPPDAAVDEDPRIGPWVDAEDRLLKGGVVMSARLVDDRLENATVIWRQTPKIVGLNHYGGRLAFLPDGTLAITSGDRQSFEVAQDRSGALGKILRINPDGSIPSDNPFAGQAAPLEQVWSLGHRNPLGAAVRPETGALYIHEMGPRHGDELNAPKPGGDYGWPAVSNGEHYNQIDIPHHETRPGDFERPLFYWRPAVSPSGLAFYGGDLFAAWRGDALLGSLSERALVRLKFDGDRIVDEERINLHVRIRDVEAAPDGAVLLLTDASDGALLRLTPTSGEEQADLAGSDRTGE